MKKILILILLTASLGAGLFAGGIDYQVGGGYSGYFFGPARENPDPVAYPLGFSVLGGVGYPLTWNLSMGAEYEFNQAWSLDWADVRNGNQVVLQEHTPRLYLRFYALDEVNLTAFTGMGIQLPRVNRVYQDREYSYVLGVRFAVKYYYFQYTAEFTDGATDSRFGVGVSLGDMLRWGYDDSKEYREKF